MSDKEKFEGFKQEMIDRNEDEYGQEVREKYGDEVVEASNRKIKNMTQQQMDDAARLSEEVNQAIGDALATKDPTGAAAMKACGLHKKWLEIYWPDGYYRPEAHKGLADMYCQDDRFRAYYEKIGPGCADFLKKAIDHYCDNGLYKTEEMGANDSRKNPEVDAYIDQFPAEVREILMKLRDLILTLAPEAKERIAYGMPTYTMKTNLIHFAGYKKHIGIYPTPDGIEVYASMHTDEMVAEYFRLADKYGLFVSGGSDYHGDKEETIGYYRPDAAIPERIYEGYLKLLRRILP